MIRRRVVSVSISLSLHAGALLAVGAALTIFQPLLLPRPQALQIVFPEDALSSPKEEPRRPASAARRPPVRIASTPSGQAVPSQEPVRPAPPAGARSESSRDEEKGTPLVVSSAPAESQVAALPDPKPRPEAPAPSPRHGDRASGGPVSGLENRPEPVVIGTGSSEDAARSRLTNRPESDGAEARVAMVAPPDTLAIPRYKENPKPFYPWRARLRGEHGVVLVAVRVTADGRAGEVAIHRSSGSMSLDEAAVAAVKKWRFYPARRGDQLVEAWVNVPIRFRLED